MGKLQNMELENNFCGQSFYAIYRPKAEWHSYSILKPNNK